MTITPTDSPEHPDSGPLKSCDDICQVTEIFTGVEHIYPDASGSDFSCVSEVHGDLYFIDFGWDREQFSALRHVTGMLSFNAYGCDFEFLRCLESVGSLVIDQPSDCLLDLSGLEALESLGGLTIIGAPAMTSLKGLEGLASGPTKLELTYLPKLTSFAPLTLSAQPTSVILDDLPEIDELTILQTATNIESLTLAQLPKLADLEDLGLLEAAGRFSLGKCGPAEAGLDGLADLAGLTNMADIDVLVIEGNAGLTSLSGAPQLHSMNTIMIRKNKSLPDSAIQDFLAQNEKPNPDVCVGLPCPCP